MEQELLTLPEHLNSPPIFSGVRVTRSLVLYVCFVDRCLSFCTFSFDHSVVCSSSKYGLWFSIFKLFSYTSVIIELNRRGNPWYRNRNKFLRCGVQSTMGVLYLCRTNEIRNTLLGRPSCLENSRLGTIKPHRYGTTYIEHESSNAINGEEKQKHIAHLLVQKVLKRTPMFIHGYKDRLSSSRTGWPLWNINFSHDNWFLRRFNLFSAPDGTSSGLDCW